MQTAYLALDAHARHSMLGLMDAEGTFLQHWRFRTTEAEMIRHVQAVQAERKLFTVEEGPLAFWIARTLAPYVEDVFVCDPRANRLVSRSMRKRDRDDAHNLCRLLRLGELKRVYHPQEDHRAVFKAAVQTYLDLRREHVRLKQKIKAQFRQWGVVALDGRRVFDGGGRADYLAQLEHPAIAAQLELYYQQLDTAGRARAAAKAQMLERGTRYAEIQRFTRVPGVGAIGAHVFDAYVQTPHRFRTRQQLWRYSGLGIVDRTSDGKPLGYQRLDRAGNLVLKAMSYHAWLGALRKREANAVRSFFEQSLARTGSRTKARLNTQRKILTCLWTLWRKDCSYSATCFLGSSRSATRAQA